MSRKKRIYLVHLKPITHGGVVYKPVVIRGMYFSDKMRTIPNIRKTAEEMGLLIPPKPGLGDENTDGDTFIRLFREAYPDELITAMGFAWLFIMHNPNLVRNVRKDLNPLRHQTELKHWEEYTVLGEDENFYYKRFYKPSYRWWRKDGFLFLAPAK